MTRVGIIELSNIALMQDQNVTFGTVWNTSANDVVGREDAV
jgi:hypothetical protein